MTRDASPGQTLRRPPTTAALQSNPEAWLAAIAESSDDGIIGKTLDSVIRSWNCGAQRIFGDTADEMVGHSVLELMPPELRHEEPEIVARLVRGERVDHYETVRVRKDGTRVDVSLSVSPIRDASGTIVGAAKVVRDITEAKRLRAAEREHIDQLQELAAELEQQIDEGQALQEELEQTNDELARSLGDAEAAKREAERARLEADEARRVAEEANAAKSQFLAMMSHELRTPLNAIAGYVDLLELGIRGPLTQEQREDLARVRRSEETLLRLIEAVLSFAKIEAGRIEYRYEEVRLDQFLGTLEAFIVPRLTQKQLSYRFEPDGADVVVSIDRDKVEQIMLNLLSNAVKFTEAGEITVRCRVERDRFTISVSDTGPGIPASSLATIFEPFVQGERSRTRMVEGSGLGLAISRQLARAMQGDITVETTEGKGSTFSLVLPCRRTP